MSNNAGNAFQVAGHRLSCPICGYSQFMASQTLMSTRGANLIGWDWSNPSADTYTCLYCGHILWFLPISGNGGGQEFEVANQKLACTLCGNPDFWTRETLMSTRGATFMNMDWANPNADNYICTFCAQVLWFMQTANDQAGTLFQTAGKSLACQICCNPHFWTRETLMSSAGATFMHFNWARPEANTFICTNCAHIHWFAQT